MRMSDFTKAFIVGAACIALASCGIFGGGGNKPKPITKKQRMQELSKIKTQMAMEFVKRQDFRGAKQAVAEAIRANPNEPQAWVVSGYVHQLLREYPQADQSMRRAIALRPNDSDLKNNYGWFLCDAMKRYQESYPYFEQAIADPTYPTPHIAYFNLGVCKGRAGDYAGSEQNFDKAEMLRPNYVYIYREKADLLWRQGKYDEAKWMFDKFQSMVPQMGPDDLYVGWKIAKSLGNDTMAYEYEAQLRQNYELSGAMRKVLNGVIE